MTTKSLEQFVRMLAALSQATRLRIVEIAAAGGEGGVAAGDIARELRCPASTLSFHLKELSQAGLLVPTPQGRFIRYSVQSAAFSALSQLIAALPAAPGTGAPGPGDPSMRRKKAGRRKQEPASGGEEGQIPMFGD